MRLRGIKGQVMRVGLRGRLGDEGGRLGDEGGRLGDEGGIGAG